MMSLALCKKAMVKRLFYSSTDGLPNAVQSAAACQKEGVDLRRPSRKFIVYFTFCLSFLNFAVTSYSLISQDLSCSAS